MYESPIEIITSQIAPSVSERMDNDIYRAVLNVGILVNKDELVKALEYDRNQYDKGFEDGAKAFAERLADEIKDTRFAYEAEQQCECIKYILKDWIGE